MKVIYKTTLGITSMQQVQMPIANAYPLSVQIQHGKPTLWALGETNRWRSDSDALRKNLNETTFIIQMIGTGEVVDLPNTAIFIGTLQFDEGALVLHCFLRTDIEI